MSLDSLYKPREKFQDILTHRTQEEKKQRDELLQQQIVQSQSHQTKRSGLKKLFEKHTPAPMNDVVELEQVNPVQLNMGNHTIAASMMQELPKHISYLDDQTGELEEELQGLLQIIKSRLEQGGDLTYLEERFQSIKTRIPQQEQNKLHAITEYYIDCLARFHLLRNGSLAPSPNPKVEDPVPVVSFDATQIDLGMSKSAKKMAKRPRWNMVQTSYEDEPLFTHEPCIQDVQQGSLGDCYFLAAVSSVIQHNPKQLMENIRDNGNNTVTVRFFRKRTQSEVNKDGENKEYLRLEQMDYANMTAKERFHRLLGSLASQQLRPNQPLTLEFIKKSGLLTDKDAQNHVKELMQSHVQKFQMTPQQANEYLRNKEQIKTYTEMFWSSKDATLTSLKDQIQSMSGDWLQKTAAGKTVVDSVLDSTPPALAALVSTLKDPKSTMEQAMAQLLAANFHHEFFRKYVMETFSQNYKAETGKDFDRLNLDDTEVFQEIRVTVTKDLPEQEIGGFATKELYAKGPLWLRLMEKAYAASGLNGQDGSKHLEALPHSFESMEGGGIDSAFMHLTGKKAAFRNLMGSVSTKSDSDVSLIGGMDKFLNAKLQKEQQGQAAKTSSTKLTLSDKLTAAYQDVFENRQKEAKQLQKLLEQHEKDQTGTAGKYIYRKSASGIDDLVNLIVNSKMKLVDGSVQSEENQQARRELALRLAGDLAKSKDHNLQFARFTGEYTDNALDVYNQIEKAIRDGKALGAGSQRFIPQNVNASGRNQEAIREGIAEGHAYSIMGVKEDIQKKAKFVVLRNPWASGELSYHKREDGSIAGEPLGGLSNDGVFLIELNDFMRRFATMYYQE